MKFAVIIMLFTMAYLNVFAQNRGATTYTLTGKLIDSLTARKLEYVTVSQINEQKVLEKRIITNADGSFRLTGLKPALYYLSFSSVGFNSKTECIDLRKQISETVDLGAIFLISSSTNLKEVSVVAEKPLIKQESDRISYNLEADPESKGTNLITMMGKIPFLSVSANGDVLLKGKDDFKVFLNGRPSSMFERNLKEILASMPASTIQRIEVITNPPARYSAEGLGGIINIITVKPLAGYKGNVNVSERFPVGGPTLGASLAYKEGKFGVSAIGGGNYSHSPLTHNSTERISMPVTEARLMQNGSKQSEGQGGYFGVDLSYEQNKLNLLTAQLNINGNRTENKTNQSSSAWSEEGDVQGYQLNNSGMSKGFGWDAGLNYQLGFKKDKNRLLTFSYLFLTHENRQRNGQLITNRTNYDEPDFIQRNLGRTREHTFQTDYVQLYKKVLVEVGLKGINRDNSSNFSHLYNGHSDSIRSNVFDNSQKILAAYNSYQFTFSKLEIKAGFRAELSSMDVDFISSSLSVDKNYFNIVPSASTIRKFASNTSINFGYSQRIKRPGINRLNPFVDRSNPAFEISGNPNLRPALIHSIQLGYSSLKKTSWNIGIDYSFASNMFLQVNEFDPDRKITRTTFQNTGKASGLNANLYLNMPVNRKLRLTFNGNTGYNWLQGSAAQSNVGGFEVFTYNLNVSSAYNLSEGWRVNASINAVSRNILSLQSRSNAMLTTSVGINKEIVKNRLSFSASTSNPFSKHRRSVVETTGSNFFQNSYSQDYFRAFYASLNYSFGKLKESIKKNKRGIKNDDLSN